MNKHPTSPTRVLPLIGLIAAVLSGNIAIAQQSNTQAAQPNTEAEADAVVLSPFVVKSSEDSGYVATSSLAGTRIKENLKNIAASISVVTKDMMTDLGANNAEQLLTYTLGTEVSGPHGSFSGADVAPATLAQDSVNRNFLPNQRIRGLALADNTRDYFLTSVPWDGFNTDRVEINRGPNSMLFGTGSPSGIVNQTTIKPVLSRNRTELSFIYDQFGSNRALVDNNTVLIKDKLAVRTALKYSDSRFRQEEAFIRDKRGFVSLEYKPITLMTVRASYEQGRQSSVKPQWRPPFDLGINAWFDLGKPAYDNTNNSVTLTGTWNKTAAPVGAINANGTRNTQIVQGSFNAGAWAGNNPTIVFDQPNSIGIVGAPLYTNAFAGGVSGLQVVTNQGPFGRSLAGLVGSRQYLIAQHAGQVGASNYNEQQFSDSRIFDFYNHMLEGGNKPEGAKWHHATVALEQLLPSRNGGIEVYYNREHVHTSFNNPFNWAYYGIGIDINTKLLDGSTNPNYGRPVIASGSWTTETLQKREDTRATAFYRLSLKKVGPDWLGRLLGTHTLTANYSDSSFFTVTNGGRGLVAGPDWGLNNPGVYANIPSWNPNVYTIDNNAQRGFSTVVYLGDAATGNTPYGLNIRPVTANVLLPGVQSVNAMFYNRNTNVWQKTGVSIVPISEFDMSAIDLTWTGGPRKTGTVSKVAILRSDLLDNTVALTLGYREDALKFWNAPGNVFLPGGYASTKSPLPSKPTSTDSNHAFNWGVVAHLPYRLQRKLPFDLAPSIFYNKSDNFNPTAQRINIYGESIDPTKGESKEYGLILSGFGEKLYLRFTHFDTALTGVSQNRSGPFGSLLRFSGALALADIQSPNSFNLAGNAAAASAFMNWYNNDPVAKQLRSVYSDSLAVLPTNMLQTVDTVAQGNEIEVAYNPTQNWRIAANFSSQKVVNANSSVDAYKLLNQLTPVLQGPAGQVWIYNTQLTWQQQAQTWVNAIDFDNAQNGHTSAPELRKNHFNLLTNYSFRGGLLKGFGIGGAARWASKVLIGTGFVRSTTLNRDVPDFQNLYYGPAESRFDAWISYRRKLLEKVNWSIQLNVRNIGVGKKLIPTVAQPDGSIAQWRIAEPMTWTISNKFEF